jgi:hypothetical protein
MSSNTITIRKKFLTSKSPEETFYSLKNTLSRIGLKSLKIRKSVENSYLLVEYKEGFMKKGEIEFNFIARQTKTHFSIDWSYPSDEEDQEESSNNDEMEFGEGVEIITSIFSMIRSRKSSSLDHEKLIEDLRFKMDATELSAQNTDTQPQKEVAVKIRCRGCLNVYDEELYKCPRCGLAG